MEVIVKRKELIHRITGLNFCGKKCGCGERNRLWWFPVCGDDPPEWVPGWMNGVSTEEVWKWLKGNRPQEIAA
jgi:hypothetical protein